THDSVVAAGGGDLQRSPANGHVFLTTCQGVEGNATKGRVSAISTGGAIESCQCPITDSDVKAGGCVFPRPIATNSCVKVAECVIPHRRSANSGEMFAGGVLEGGSKTNGQVEAGSVLGERLRPNGHVKITVHVSAKCATTNRDVISAVSIARKRIF